MTGRIALAAALCCGTALWGSGGTYHQVTYAPSKAPGELQLGVTYTVWVPDHVKRLRLVIVHQHGCGAGACKGGATAAYDLHWQALARKWDAALLGPSYQQADGQDCALWSDPRNGSRAAFLKALRELGAKSGHPEMATAPWALWGHSGGGTWSGHMQALDPGRIAAIWFRSGSVAPTESTPAAANAIPMVCNPGKKEETHERFQRAYKGCLATFSGYRARGAPIAFAPDPRTAHECGDSRYLAIPFFDAAFALRLPKKGEAPDKLRAVDAAGGLVKSELTVEESWLPGPRLVEAWKEYVRTGAVSDATPPPAPHHVKATRDGVVTWEADADFESGLAGFVIERDGREIGRAPAKPVGRFGRPLFQTMSYHDTPEAPLPEMRFTDPSPKAGARYRVIAVNSVGLRSKPSK
jgi:hypothetical protein